jgi:hypothetical protein
MNYSDLWLLIQDNANREAWLYTDGKHTWTLRADLNVTIREVKTEDDEKTLLTEAWTQGFNHSYLMEFDVYYGASYVESFWLAAVDEYRAFLPLPIPDTKKVKRREHIYAQCVNFRLGQPEDYMSRCRFTPVDED